MMVKKAGYHGTAERELAEETFDANIYHRLRELRDAIVSSVYGDAAVYEAKKKLVEVGSFEWNYYEMKQATCLVIAKSVEHMNLEDYLT